MSTYNNTGPGVSGSPSIDSIDLSAAGQRLFRLNNGIIPLNNHGGLLGLAAPGEAPAAYSVVEAVFQIRKEGSLSGRLAGDVENALVYANGGVFSASGVAILTKYKPQNTATNSHNLVSKL